MKHRLSAVLIGAIAAVVFGQIASAADLPRKAPAYMPPPPPVLSWSGFYVGASAGGRWSDTKWDSTCLEIPCVPGFAVLLEQRNPQSFDSSTFRGGIYVGYNWQVAPSWVVGLEGDAAWGDSSETVAGIPGAAYLGAPPSVYGNDSSTVKEGWDGSIRARLGFLVAPTWLVYATGGAAWQRVSLIANCVAQPTGAWCLANRSEEFSTTKVGWTVGAGVETMVWGNWLARVEYRFADFGHIDHAFFSNAPVDTVTMNETLKTHTVLFGLAYKFGGGL